MNNKAIKIIGIIALIVVIGIILVKIFHPKKVTKMTAYDKNDPINDKFKYFVMSEFDSPALMPYDKDQETYKKGVRSYIKNSGKNNMDYNFVKMLDDAREIIEKEWNSNKPGNRIVFAINSGYRTKHFNGTLDGAVPNSAHTKGHAADINVKGWSKDKKDMVLDALKRVGFERVGIYDTFFHADNDPTLLAQYKGIWNYGSPAGVNSYINQSYFDTI